jgi:hypothetical protein
VVSGRKLSRRRHGEACEEGTHYGRTGRALIGRCGNPVHGARPEHRLTCRSMSRERAVALLACIASALCAVAASTAGGSKDVVLVRKSATGRHAQVVPSAVAPRNAKISVRVGAVPNQRVSGYWTVACQYGANGSSRDAGDVRGRTPLTVPVRVAPYWPIGSCTVVGTVRLSGRGRITVELIAH